MGDWRWTDLPAPWLLTLLALLLLFAARALYATEKARAGRAARLALAAVRAGILFLLLLVIAGPYREEVTVADERSHLAILVDSSASMATVDRLEAEQERALLETAFPDGSDEPRPGALALGRLPLVQRILAGTGEPLLRRLDERFVLHVFAFDEDLRSLGATREEGPTPAGAPGDPVAAVGEAIRALEPVGDETRVGLALANAAAEFLGQQDARFAGVLLVTDGRDTGERESALDALAGLGNARRDLHVTAVALGNAKSGLNARVERIRAKDVVLIGDTVLFETAVRHTGLAGTERVSAVLTVRRVAEADGTPVDRPVPYRPGGREAGSEAPPFTLGREEDPSEVRLRAAFPDAGTYEVRIEVRLPSGLRDQDAVREDDFAVHEVRVVDQRIKVLFVDQEPRYDWRFLSNWLTREPDDRTIRRPGSSELRRRYAAHVLLRSADPTVEQPRSADLDPLAAFPATRRELFAYDVLILGDVDPRDLAASPEDASRLPELIAEFVKEGGGLCLEAGVDCRNPLDFVDTALRDLLPVAARARDKTPSERTDAAFRLALTEAGARHPIFAVIPGRGGEPPTPEELEGAWRSWNFWWLYRAGGGLKPGAVALATASPADPADRSFVDDQGRPLVAMATMSHGKGRVFWSAVDNLSVLRRARRDEIFGPFWDQVIRHLATYRLLGGNKRYKILTDKDSYFVDETATVTITALDPDFEPLEDPVLEGLHLEGPDGQEIPLDESRRPRNEAQDGGAPGTYRTHLSLRRPGTYRLWIEAPGKPGERAERAEKRFLAESKSAEQRLTLPNHELLKRIARETDGRVVALQDLPDLVEDPERLPSRTVERILDRRERSQWDRGWVLLLLAGLLVVEWIVRRRLQMI
jgi:hypothetical protein